MKFAICLFIGLCILLPAQAYRTGKVYDQFRILDGLSLYFNETVGKVENKVKTQLNDLKIETNKEFEILVKDNIIPLIEELIQKGGIYKQCAEGLVPEYEIIKKEFSESFQICLAKDNDEFNKFSQKIAEDRKNIRVSSKSYEVNVRTCAFLPLYPLITCLTKQYATYQGIYDSVISSSTRCLNDAQQSGNRITSESRSCYLVVLDKNKLEILKLKQQLTLCYKH